MRYFTRRRPHVDRCASAWLLKRFVDPQADFVFVDEGAQVPGAIPFDISGAGLGHRRGRCTFEAILANHKLRDPALVELGRIIRSADLLDADETLEGPGIDLLFRGLLHLSGDDHKVLALGEPILDALYTALRERRADRSRRRASRQRKG
ncbi:MAG TPA: chromate resistance protein ChrB domain-containing protein [Candidatus Methylomirabilis sp.]|nr:chromate resistance protein ChrB domain-containing protein [Candidatus Methylomirabilis sp.]